MQLPSSIIYRLLLGEHIFPQEREQLGITPATKISFEYLVQFLANEIVNTDRFPPKTKVESLSPTYEGIIVTRASKNKFICTVKRAFADNHAVIAEQSETIFRNAKDAATFFLNWDLCLPGWLDGIVVQ